MAGSDRCGLGTVCHHRADARRLDYAIFDLALGFLCESARRYRRLAGADLPDADIAQQQTGKVHIDYTGAGPARAGTVPLLLGFTWAGTQYPWLSPQIIGMLRRFRDRLDSLRRSTRLYLERRGGQPIIEPSLFKNSIFSVSTIVTTIFGMGLFGSIFFIPLFVQGVVGSSATNSGLILTPLLLTSVVGSIVSGQLVSRLGRYKWLAILGMFISLAGTLLLARLDVNSGNNDVLVAMLVLGLGMGFGMSLYTLVVQNALPTKIGQATSTLTFFRSIGGTVALAIMGSVMNSAYLPAFQSALPAQVKQLVASHHASHRC